MKTREGLKAYNKTNPIAYEDFSDVIAWWKDKRVKNNAWKVDRVEIENLNLDIKNPNNVVEPSNLTTFELIENLIQCEKVVLHSLMQIKELMSSEFKNDDN